MTLNLYRKYTLSAGQSASFYRGPGRQIQLHTQVKLVYAVQSSRQTSCFREWSNNSWSATSEVLPSGEHTETQGVSFVVNVRRLR